MSALEAAQFLDTYQVFPLLTAEERLEVASHLVWRQVEAGKLIFREGAVGQEMFFLAEGLVESWQNQTVGRGRKITLFRPGSIFGEMAVVEADRRSATCTAVTAAGLWVLPALDFYNLVWEQPALGVKLLSALNRLLIHRLKRAVTFLDSMVKWGERARRQAVADDMTGLFNRRYLEEMLDGLLQDNRPDRPVSIIFMDLDRFREINDKFGPTAGDAIISTVGTTIQRVLREGDIGARLSGDEYALLLPETSKEEAMLVGRRLLQETADLYLEFRAGKGQQPVRQTITISLGLATYPEDGTGKSALFEAADSALFAAKGLGRNQIVKAPVGQNERRADHPR